MPNAVMTPSSSFTRGTRIALTKSSATLVNTTLDHIISTSGIERLFIQITVAVAALTGFAVKGKSHPDAANVTLYSAASDYTLPAGLIVGASGDLTTQAVGALGWLILDVRSLDSVTITATSGGTATVALFAGGV